MTSVFLGELGLVCALGSDKGTVARALLESAQPRALATVRAPDTGRRLSLGAVDAPLPDLSRYPPQHRGRNNSLLLAALNQIRPAVEAAIEQVGNSRVGVILGTSTSGIGESEKAQGQLLKTGRWPKGFHYAQQEMGAAARFVANELGVAGPAHVISTACSSSAKALASGARLLRSGAVDFVIAGGADMLCDFTIAGFAALESVATERCNPFSANRCGINIGEGAALFLMGKQPAAVRLAGWGESSDAHHMSSPDPSGRGAGAAVRSSLARAGITASDVDYINLHGTATVQNDAMEALVLHEIFGPDVASSSTKPLTGHTLGAAGAIEAALCWLALAENPAGRLPPHWWDGEVDRNMPRMSLVAPGQIAARPLKYLLSQSFAFGGSNASLLLGAA